jgi:hypothetical protein
VVISRIISRRALRCFSFAKAVIRFSLLRISRGSISGKLGASINIFDGEELLLDLIYSVRQEVDYLSIIYQGVGHWGNNLANPHLLEFLQSLKDVGLVDEVYEWKTNGAALDVEEFNSLDMRKREKGLQLARDNGCTHFLNLDNDELYTHSDLAYMKRVVMGRKGRGIDYSVLRHFQYYKSSDLILRHKEQEYVMGIIPLRAATKFEYGVFSPFPIDPGRKVRGNKIMEFWRFEVCMHHLSYVRKDIRTKLVSAHARDGNLVALDKIINRYQNYNYPEPGYWGHGIEVELKKIKPRVSIKFFENDAFGRFERGESLKSILGGLK